LSQSLAPLSPSSSLCVSLSPLFTLPFSHQSFLGSQLSCCKHIYEEVPMVRNQSFLPAAPIKNLEADALAYSSFPMVAVQATPWLKPQRDPYSPISFQLNCSQIPYLQNCLNVYHFKLLILDWHSIKVSLSIHQNIYQILYPKYQSAVR
jgi:hypothetical protein